MSRWTALSLLLGLTSASTGSIAQEAANVTVAFDWGDQAHHRWYMETEVVLPRFMWFKADFNKQARVSAFQVRMVVDCGHGVPLNKKTYEVECVIEDIGLSGSALPVEVGLLQPILDEADAGLTGATIQLQVKSNGRVSNVDLFGTDDRNRREREMHENLRLVLVRALAGLDIQVPRNGDVSAAWGQYDNLLFSAPAAVGTQGSSETVHQLSQDTGEALVFRSAGQGMVVPDAGYDNYACRYEGVWVFHRKYNIVTEHTWTVIGDPTASSGISEGVEGIPYAQRGRLQYLAAGQTMDVGESMEMHPPGVQPSTLQRWIHLGYPANGSTP